MSISSLLQLPVRVVRKVLRESDRCVAALPTRQRRLEQSLIEQLGINGIPSAIKFDFEILRDTALDFAESLSDEPGGVQFRYAHSVSAPTIYSSVYVLMLYSLFNAMDRIRPERRQRWREYLDSMQNAEDGLFYDPVLDGPEFRRQDWWGARHLAPHVLMAYTALGEKPPHSFRFLREYNSREKVTQWLENLRRSKPFVDASNQIMNIGVLMQYERDARGDSDCAAAMDGLFDYMNQHMDLKTGLWWRGHPIRGGKALSHAVQGAYHLHPLYLYDGVQLPAAERMVQHVLQTQGPLGGFGLTSNSTGCEDIDSIFPLCMFGLKGSSRSATERALLRTLPWVLSHRNPDGGFSWVRYRKFTYGHPVMTAEENESELFGTWFRLLSLAYLSRALGLPHGFHLNRCPGYEIA